MAIIAIVEDDADQRENLNDALVRRGHEVLSFANRHDAFNTLKNQAVDVFVSDIILDGEYDAGFILCKALLELHPQLPVIFMTERVDEIDQVHGIRLGAVDYLPKPFSINVMSEKIAALVRRQSLIAQQEEGELIYETNLSIKEAFNEVCWKGEAVSLTVIELRMLIRLVNAHGRILSKSQLGDETRSGIVQENTVNTHIKNIRKKFKLIDEDFAAIKSEYGVGYKWSP